MSVSPCLLLMVYCLNFSYDTYFAWHTRYILYTLLSWISSSSVKDKYFIQMVKSYERCILHLVRLRYFTFPWAEFFCRNWTVAIFLHNFKATTVRITFIVYEKLNTISILNVTFLLSIINIACNFFIISL